MQLPSFFVKGFEGSEGTIDEKGSRIDCMNVSILWEFNFSVSPNQKEVNQKHYKTYSEHASDDLHAAS
jgi:hypothetical protein